MAYTQVADINDLQEGTGKRIEVNGKTVALFKVKGEIFAISDACAHAGANLSEGTVEDNCVICPRHGFDFDLKTGNSSRGCQVQTFQVKIENNKVFLEI